MKIKVFLNNIKVDIKDDFQKAKEYFARHNLPIEWVFEETKIKGYKVITQNFGSVGYRNQITGHEDKLNLLPNEISIFVFNGNEFTSKNMPTSKCELINKSILITLMTYKEGDEVGETYSTLIHEMMHGVIKWLGLKGIFIDDPMDIWWRNNRWEYYYHNDQPDSQDSNFGEAWRLITPYLNTLDTTTYKYFSQKEVDKWKLKPELFAILDKIREECGFPLIITSGLRSIAQNNALKDAVSDSSHLIGLAVDLAISDSIKRFKLVSVALKNGIVRIGIGKGFVHLDIDSNKLQNCMWDYY